MEIGAAAAVAFQDAPQQRRELELELAGLAAGLPEVPDDHPDVDGVVLGPGTPEPVDVMVVDPGITLFQGGVLLLRGKGLTMELVWR